MENQPTKPPAPSACGDCRHFVKASENERKGECHRYPPTAFPTGFSAFPSTWARSFCGEFSTGKPAVAEKVKPDTSAQAERARRSDGAKK